MQPLPAYPAPVHHYPGHGSGQQQPLFIIIPSAGKSKPHVMPAPAPPYYEHRHYEYPHRRSILKLNKPPAPSSAATTYQQSAQKSTTPSSSLNSKASRLFGKLGLDVSRADLIEQQHGLVNKHDTDGYSRASIKPANTRRRPTSSSSSSSSSSHHMDQETADQQDTQILGAGASSHLITDLSNELNIDVR